MAEYSQQFKQKAPFQMFDWVLNTSLIMQWHLLLSLIEAANLNLPKIFLIWIVLEQYLVISI